MPLFSDSKHHRSNWIVSLAFKFKHWNIWKLKIFAGTDFLCDYQLFGVDQFLYHGQFHDITPCSLARDYQLERWILWVQKFKWCQPAIEASLQKLKNDEVEQFGLLRSYLSYNNIDKDLSHRVTRFLQHAFDLKNRGEVQGCCTSLNGFRGIFQRQICMVCRVHFFQSTDWHSQVSVAGIWWTKIMISSGISQISPHSCQMCQTKLGMTTME